MKKIKPPKNPIHPGEFLLEEFIEPKRWAHAYVAEQLGWTKAKLNELIKGKRPINAEMALDLSSFLRTSAKIWMNFQSTFDLVRDRKNSPKS